MTACLYVNVCTLRRVWGKFHKLKGVAPNLSHREEQEFCLSFLRVQSLALGALLFAWMQPVYSSATADGGAHMRLKCALQWNSQIFAPFSSMVGLFSLFFFFPPIFLPLFTKQSFCSDSCREVCGHSPQLCCRGHLVMLQSPMSSSCMHCPELLFPGPQRAV